MEGVLHNPNLSNEEKARLYSQTLQNYLTYYNQRKDEPMKIKFESNEPEQEGNDEPPPPAPQVAVRPEVQDRIERDIVNALPKALKPRGKMMIQKILENPDIMKWDERGQLLFENKLLPGSHIVDLIGDFMRERKGIDPIGWQVFARGLARMNAPEDLVRNERRREALREFKTRRNEQEDPSVWLPTPPPTASPQVTRELPFLSPVSEKTPRGSFRGARARQPPRRWLT